MNGFLANLPYLAVAGASLVLQSVIVWLLRSKGWSLLGLAPLILVQQASLLWTYGKAPSFGVQWFLVAGLSIAGAFAMSVVLFGEQPTPRQLCGMGLIAAGMVFVQMK